MEIIDRFGTILDIDNSLDNDDEIGIVLEENNCGFTCSMYLNKEKAKKLITQLKDVFEIE